MKIDSTFLLTLANIFDNLSAGWFGAAFIIPTFSGWPTSFSLPILTVDLTFGIFCLIVAYTLRKRGGRK